MGKFQTIVGDVKIEKTADGYSVHDDECFICGTLGINEEKFMDLVKRAMAATKENAIEVKLGQELPPEIWMKAAENLEQVFPVIAERLLLINNEGKGQEDADGFMADATLALTAIRYVAEFAHDKCRFIAK